MDCIKTDNILEKNLTDVKAGIILIITFTFVNVSKALEFEIDEPQFRLLSADYHEFVSRDKLCREVIKGLQHTRSTSVCLVGIGGVGKTALATWAVKNAYKNGDYDYIISISAKDRELTPSGIQAISQKMTSLDDLLNVILDVMGFSEYKEQNISIKKKQVYDLLNGEKALLYIDNLETAVDKDIISGY